MLTINPINRKLIIKVKRKDYEVDFIVKPLTYREKSAITAATMKIDKGDVVEDRNLGLFLTLKDSLLGIKGVTSPDGSPYELDHDEDGRVSDESLEAILDSSLNDVLNYYAYSAQSKTPDQIIDITTGKPLKGVTIVPDNDTMQKKS